MLFGIFELILYDWREKNTPCSRRYFLIRIQDTRISYDTLCIGIVSRFCLQDYKVACALSLHIQSSWIHFSHDFNGEVSRSTDTQNPAVTWDACVRLYLKVTANQLIITKCPWVFCCIVIIMASCFWLDVTRCVERHIPTWDTLQKDCKSATKSERQWLCSEQKGYFHYNGMPYCIILGIM